MTSRSLSAAGAGRTLTDVWAKRSCCFPSRIQRQGHTQAGAHAFVLADAVRPLVGKNVFSREGQPETRAPRIARRPPTALIAGFESPLPFVGIDARAGVGVFQ